MSTSLTRRIRRIGLLPKRTIDQILDANMLLKIRNRTNTVAEREEYDSIAKELASAPRRLDLTPEQVGEEVAKLRIAWAEKKAKAIANQQKPKSNYRRSKARRKATK